MGMGSLRSYSISNHILIINSLKKVFEITLFIGIDTIQPDHVYNVYCTFSQQPSTMNNDKNDLIFLSVQPSMDTIRCGMDVSFRNL